ncbi:MAG: hypothetical protein O7I93_14530 [Gemmatimonadetes bacterium]|nr:hypothetical protein [Gemmatimonadota bacterium]
MKIFVLGLLFLTLLSGVPVAGSAQVQDTLPERPFVRGGVYDRPYLTTLLGRTAIGGYAEMHARWERVDGLTEERGFELKRWNLFTATEVSDFIRISAEIEFEDGGQEITVEFAAIDFRIAPSFTVRGGMLLSPIGRFNLAHDSPMNEFTDRPLVSRELLGTALSEPGLGVLGTVPLQGSGRITYEVYAVNGFHDGLVDDSPDGTRVPLGRGNFEDNNNVPAIVGRVAWSPSLNLAIGLSAHHGAYNVFNEEGLAVDQRRDLTMAAVDLEAVFSGFRMTGEGALIGIDISEDLTGVYASKQHGFYFEILRDFGRGWIETMPASFFSAGIRLDLIDLDADLPGDNTRQVTLGANFRPTQDTVFKFNYVRGTSRDRFNNPADHGALLFSIATYF